MANSAKNIGVIFATCLLGSACQGAGTWAEYEQLLPRGEIAAITQPVYVSAAEATINDDSYVLGVVVEGQPLAYSLNLLNDHEVVNDQIGNTQFAAVW